MCPHHCDWILFHNGRTKQARKHTRPERGAKTETRRETSAELRFRGGLCLCLHTVTGLPSIPPQEQDCVTQPRNPETPKTMSKNYIPEIYQNNNTQNNVILIFVLRHCVGCSLWRRGHGRQYSVVFCHCSTSPLKTMEKLDEWQIRHLSIVRTHNWQLTHASTKAVFASRLNGKRSKGGVGQGKTQPDDHISLTTMSES